MAGDVEAPGRGGRSSCFVEVGRREIGSSFPRASSRRISGSEDIVMRMTRHGKLKGHAGCVNTVSFNPTGDLLVSGSDDTNIILWDWLAKTKKLVYPSGHQENVFHACVMPFTDDSTIVTVAADCQVRVGQLKKGGEVTTRQIGEHADRVHKLALEPGSPYIFYTCGEDGLVQRFDLRSDSETKLFTCHSFSNNRRRMIQATLTSLSTPSALSILSRVGRSISQVLHIPMLERYLCHTMTNMSICSKTTWVLAQTQS